MINLVIKNTVDLICRRLAVHNIKENDIEMITKTVGSDYMRYKYYKSHCGFWANGGLLTKEGTNK